MLRRSTGALAFGGLALLAAPSVGAAQAAGAVTGEVYYLERVLLPPAAQVNVQLQDVSRADAPAIVVSEQNLTPGGVGPPYAFRLPYDPARIQATNTYVVRAQIRAGDQLLFTSTQSYPVITRGAPTSGVRVLVQRVGGGAGPGVTLPATGGGAGAAPALRALAALGAVGAVGAALLGGSPRWRRTRRQDRSEST
jgi:putative lipoprotein